MRQEARDGHEMKLARLGVLLIALCAGGCGGATAGEQTASNAPPPTGDSAMLSWSAFECSTYAGMAGHQDEQKRLFQLGYDSGKRYLDALQQGAISEKDIQAKAPMAFSMNASGPTVDFMLGRIFATASTHGFDRIVTEDRAGATLPIEDWQMDPEIRKALAETEFRNQNCSLLR